MGCGEPYPCFDLKTSWQKHTIMLWFCSVTSKLSYIFSYSEWWRYIGSRKPRQPRIRKVPAWASNRTIRGLIYDINIQSAYGGLIFFTREQGSLLKKRSAGCALARSENLSLKRPRSAREFRKRNSRAKRGRFSSSLHFARVRIPRSVLFNRKEISY